MLRIQLPIQIIGSCVKILLSLLMMMPATLSCAAEVTSPMQTILSSSCSESDTEPEMAIVTRSAQASFEETREDGVHAHYVHSTQTTDPYQVQNQEHIEAHCQRELYYLCCNFGTARLALGCSACTAMGILAYIL